MAIPTEIPKKLEEVLTDFHHNESAATATEYIILLILVACLIIAIVKAFGQTTSRKYKDAADTVRKEVRVD